MREGGGGDGGLSGTGWAEYCIQCSSSPGLVGPLSTDPYRRAGGTCVCGRIRCECAWACAFERKAWGRRNPTFS